jgi:hypothetical protein
MDDIAVEYMKISTLDYKDMPLDLEKASSM